MRTTLRVLGRAVCVALLFGAFFAAPAMSYLEPSGQTAPGGDGLARLFPEDTPVFMSLRNAQEMVKKWKASPFQKLMDHEAYRPVVEEFQEKWDEATEKFHGETGLDLKEFLNLFDGEVALAMPGLTSVFQMIEKEVEKGKPMEGYNWKKHFKTHGMFDCVFVAEARARAKDVDAFMDKIFATAGEKKGLTLESKVIEGVEATVIKPKSDPAWYYARVDSLCIFASTEHALASVIRRKSGGGKSLADHPEFRRLGSRLGSDTDLVCYMDPQPLVKVIKKAIRAEVQKNAAMGPYEDVINRFVESIFGFDKLSCVGFGMTLGSESASFSAYAGSQGELQGLLKLFAGKKDRIELRSFLPRDLTSVTVLQPDIQAFWAGLDEVITMAVKKYQEQSKQKVNPLRMVEQMMGFKIGDVVSVLDSEIICYTLPGRDKKSAEPRRMVLWHLKDPRKAQELMDKLLDNPFIQMGTVDIVPKEVDGFKVYDISTPMRTVSAGLVDSWLAVGSDQDMTAEFIKRYKKSDSGSIQDRPDYSVLRSKLAVDASLVSYVSAAEALQEMYRKSGRLDPKKMPSAAFYEQLFSGVFAAIVPEKDGALFRWELQYRR